RLGAAQLMVLAGVTAQEIIKRRLAAVERTPIVSFADRLFMPGSDRHARGGNARAAANNRVFGGGGFSSNSRTRRLSRSDNRKCSAFSMISLAARRAFRRTKSVRSVC